jgi:sulfite reductase (NADPH) hemoprotein beta-component
VNGKIQPVKEREIIRAAGPDVHPIPASRRVKSMLNTSGQTTRSANMYRYDEFDAQFVSERVNQFAGQVARRLSGELTEDQFKPLRPDERPLSAASRLYAAHRGALRHPVLQQVRKLAHIARTYDKNFGHFTTRQNLQFNWIKLVDVPAILRELADVGDALHPDIRQSACASHRRPVRRRHRRGNRDPRPLAEIIRQWSEPASGIRLPGRKFKIAWRLRA